MRASDASVTATQWAPRPSSFAAANALGANLGSREEGCKLIWDPKRRVAICKPVYSVAFCEDKRAIGVGSQQRMRSRDRPRQDPQDCQCLAHHKQEANRVMVLLQQAEIISIAIDLAKMRQEDHFSGSREKLTGSGSEMDVPSSTAKIGLCCGRAHHH